MTSSDKDLFFEALDPATREQRVAFLEEACRGDPGKRQRLDELLALHDQQNPFMTVPAAGPASHPPTPDPAEA